MNSCVKYSFAPVQVSSSPLPSNTATAATCTILIHLSIRNVYNIYIPIIHIRTLYYTILWCEMFRFKRIKEHGWSIKQQTVASVLPKTQPNDTASTASIIKAEIFLSGCAPGIECRMGWLGEWTTLHAWLSKYVACMTCELNLERTRTVFYFFIAMCYTYTLPVNVRLNL